jgi:hypothetical protein
MEINYVYDVSGKTMNSRNDYYYTHKCAIHSLSPLETRLKKYLSNKNAIYMFIFCIELMSYNEDRT